jgi:branched-chain amino acid transport system ATP-binding protein
MSAALEVVGLFAGYGGASAIRDISFSLGPGEILSIVGPNGAGKTTTLSSVIGVVKPSSGHVRLMGEDITGLTAHRVARRGACLIPDNRGLFPDLTVSEHLQMAVRSPVRKKAVEVEPISPDEVQNAFPQLEALRKRPCGLLSGGEQQMLAIAKSLLLSPRVLLIDELSLGLAPVIVSRLLPAVQQIAKSTNMSVVIVEQHYKLALAVADQGLVLNHGEVVLQGSARSLLADPQALQDAYLGAAHGNPTIA